MLLYRANGLKEKYIYDFLQREGITPEENEKIKNQQKLLDRIVKARNRNMIIAYNIKKKLEKSYKRSLICQDIFQTFYHQIKL